MKLFELLTEKKQQTRAEKDMKRNAGKQALTDLHAKQQAEKRAAFDAKYNHGKPVKMKIDVDLGGGKSEQREFTIDGLLSIRHKLEGITLIDMSKLAGHKGDKPTYAIKTDNVRFYSGSLPEFLFDLPKRTRQKKEFVGTNDLRRETFAV